MAEKQIEEIIKKRYSCRSYRDIPLSEKDRLDIGEFISQKFTGPFGGSARFKLFAAESSDSDALKGLAPSASNKQPWRVVKENGKNVFHFFLERTAGYGKQIKIIGGADLQRVDMGIAMCHFETAAAENGLKGVWKFEKPSDLEISSEREYIATWNGN